MGRTRTTTRGAAHRREEDVRGSGPGALEAAQRDPRCHRCRRRRRAVSELCGLSLTASITGGLAALLALFTVTDATVRDQRITTALLPIAGFPVLAFATTLHGITPARDAAFLAVVFCGVYARRWARGATRSGSSRS
ncbi:hypothetical protein GCM10011428_60170 [Streptomyces violaceus]